MKVCREAVIHHMENDPSMETPSENRDALPTSGEVANDPDLSTVKGFDVTPTIITRGYVEFKFASMKIVFGVVFYTNRKDYNRFLITNSRNCHSWEPIREKEGYGEAKVRNACMCDSSMPALICACT